MKRTLTLLLLLAALLALGPIAPVPAAAPARPGLEKSRAVRHWLDRDRGACPEPARTDNSPTFPEVSQTVLSIAPRPVGTSCGPVFLSGEMTLIAQAFPIRGVAHLVGGGGLGGFNLPCIGCPKQPIFPVNVRLGDTWITIFPGGPPSDVPVVVRIHPCKDLLIFGTLHVAFNGEGKLDGKRSSLDLNGSVDVDR